MARTKPSPVIITKYSDVWIKHWKNIPQPTNIPLAPYVKRLIKYYPKTFESLKPLSLLFHDLDGLERINKIRIGDQKAFNIITRRYKKDFFRHFALNKKSKNLIRKIKMTSLQYLSIDTSKLSISRLFLRKLMTQNKAIKAVEWSDNEKSSANIIKCLRYLKFLGSFILKDLPFLSPEAYQHILLSKTKLHSLSITSAIDSEDEAEETLNKDPDYFMKVLDIFLALPGLKRFRFDGRVSEGSDVSIIPFNVLQKKGMHYDLRVSHSQKQLEFTHENSEALKELDFLGLNFKEGWVYEIGGKSELCMEWGVYQEESLRAQENSKKLFYINQFAFTKIDLTCMFQSCQNITTLDLIIPSLEYYDIEFQGIQSLCNLRNLFLHIENLERYLEGIFDNLKICAEKFNTLEQINLNFKYQGNIDISRQSIAAFFKACANTVSKAIIQVSDTQGSRGGASMSCIYRSLQEFTQLRCFVLYFKHVHEKQETFESSHFQNIEKILDCQPALEELQLLFPFEDCRDLKIDFSKAKNLKKLCLNLMETEDHSSLLQSCFNISALRRLELSLKCFENEWGQFLKGVLKLNNLEVLVINLKILIDEKASRKHALERVIKQKPSLNMITINEGNKSRFVLVFRRRGYWESLDSFYRGTNYDRPNIVDYKVYSYL